MSDKGMSKVDGDLQGTLENPIIQTGFIGDPPKPKSVFVEKLTRDELVEKVFRAKMLRKILPNFAVRKLDKQSLTDLKRFYTELNPILQDEMITRFGNFKPSLDEEVTLTHDLGLEKEFHSLIMQEFVPTLGSEYSELTLKDRERFFAESTVTLKEELSELYLNLSP